MFISQLPDSFQDFAAAFNTKWQSQKDKILTHCHWDLMHSVWDIILDDEFLHAYEYGIVVKCADGIERRIYPRIFMYSADYPEKCIFFLSRSAISDYKQMKGTFGNNSRQGNFSVCPVHDPKVIPRSSCHTEGHEISRETL